MERSDVARMSREKMTGTANQLGCMYHRQCRRYRRIKGWEELEFGREPINVEIGACTVGLTVRCRQRALAAASLYHKRDRMGFIAQMPN